MLKKTSISLAVALTLGLGATQTIADTEGIYGGFGVGIPDYAGGNNNSDDAVISGGDSAGQLFLGYRFNDNFALEAGYADLAHGVNDDTIGGLTNPEEFHSKAFTLSMLGHLPTTERFSLYGKLGAAFWDIERSDPTGSNNRDENGTGVVVGLGADYQISRNISVRAAWDHYHNMGSKDDNTGTSDVGISLLSLNLMFHGDRAMKGPAALGDGSDHGFYIGAGGGISDFDGLICDDSDSPCDSSDNELLDKDAAWQLFAGYQFNSNWSVEAGYTDLGRARNHDDEPDDRYYAEVATLGIVGSLPVTDRMALHAKVGGAYYDVNRDDRSEGSSRYSDDGLSYTFGLGASYQLTPNYSLRANYDYYHELGEWDNGSDIGEGAGEAGVSMVSLNLMYHFKPMRRYSASMSPSNKDGFYLGLGAGNSQHDGLENTSSDYDTGKDIAYQVFGGYQFNNTWAVELGYVDLGKTFDDDTDSPGPEQAEIDLWSLSALANVDITKRLSAYTKVGATRWDVERGNDPVGPTITVKDDGYGWTVGLGATYDFDNGIGVRASWDYYADIGDTEELVSEDVGQHDAHTYMLSVFKRF